MERFDFLVSKLLDFLPGGIYGILSVIIGILGDLLAFLLFPGYNSTLNMVSDLGLGPGGIFFNLGLIISGIVAIPFYISLGKVFNKESDNIIIRKGAILSAVISCITFSFIGIFPALRGNKLMIFLHGTFSFICLLTAIGYMLLFSILMFKDERYSILHVSIGIIVACIILLFLLTWLPIIEWLLTGAIIFWVLFNSIYLIKNEDLIR